MTNSFLTLALILSSVLLAFGQEESAPTPDSRAGAKYLPIVDHHQHLFGPERARFGNMQPITADDVIKLLDTAGIERAVVLSTAFSFGRPGREPQDEYAKVKEENDWIGSQAARFPKRLIAFCSFNPLKEYALEEIARCAKSPSLRRGIKLHLGNADVQLEKPEHTEKLKQVFRAANQHGMAVVIHMRASISNDRPYGAEQGRIFLEQILPQAPDIIVQVAHLAGTGPGYDDPKADAVLGVLIDAIQKGDRRTRNLWFDVTSLAHPNNPLERRVLLAKRIREIGVKRVLYGTDAALGDNLRPREAWAEFIRLDLTDQEIKTIAKNRAPYLK